MKFRYILSALAAASLLLLCSCTNEEEYTVATEEVVTGVTTGSATTTATSAVLTGTVTGVSDLSSAAYSVGAYYGTTEDPINEGTRQSGSVDEEGNVTVTVTGLTFGTTYYYTIYLILEGSVTYYGEVKSFVATDVNVTTTEASGVSACKATLGCTVTGTDGADNVTIGVKLALSEDGVAEGREYECGALSGLLPGTTYWFAGYADVDGLTVYGEALSFTTDSQTMEFVDLGLGTLWAAWNIGAESESEIGTLAGYGDPTGLLTSTSLSAYASGDISGTEYDIAYGLSLSEDGQSLPTAEQIEALIAGTTQTAETVDGVDGIRFTAENENSIFLPLTGYRDGEDLTEDGLGHYWSGSAYPEDSDYASTLRLDGDEATTGVSSRALGLALRCVSGGTSSSVDPDVPSDEPTSGATRTYLGGTELTFDNSKMPQGDLESNGNYRMEFYNTYGSTASSGPVTCSDISFSSNIIINFTITGIDDNLKDGAPDEFYAALMYTNDGWYPTYSTTAAESPSQYEAVITGDGTYTLWWEPASSCSNPITFLVDIFNLTTYLSDATKVSVTVNHIIEDGNVDQNGVNDLTIFELNNSADGRIEIYNAYGPTGNEDTGHPNYFDNSLYFNGMMVVTFTISGIDDNLSGSAAGSYTAALSYVDATWTYSYWGDASYGSATVTGDGTYTVYTYLNGDCVGTACWCVEIPGLYGDLTDTSLVEVSIDSVKTPWKLGDE